MSDTIRTSITKMLHERSGILLIPGQHIVDFITHRTEGCGNHLRLEQPPPPLNRQAYNGTNEYSVKFRPDREGILTFQNMEELMQEYILCYSPEMIFHTIRRSASVLSPAEQKLLLIGLQKVIIELEAKLLRES